MTVEAFPMYKLSDIPESLRQLANRIELGETSARRVVVVVEPEEDSTEAIHAKGFGEEPFTTAHAIGLCYCAMHSMIT